MKEGHSNSQGSFVKCVSSGTVILKGESAENKSTQQSWPTFMLECFQRQQSLFSYAINCLNRLPVEFLMCYKFHVCFPRVDSTQAYCVRPCPVISVGLGRTSAKEKPLPRSLFNFLWTIVHKLVSLFSFPSATMESIHYICTVHQWPCATYSRRVFSLCSSFLFKVGVEAGEGHRAMCGSAKQIIPQHSGELDSSEGTSLGFVSSKCKISRHRGAFTCRSQTLLPIHFNA